MKKLNKIVPVVIASLTFISSLNVNQIKAQEKNSEYSFSVDNFLNDKDIKFITEDEYIEIYSKNKKISIGEAKNQILQQREKSAKERNLSEKDLKMQQRMWIVKSYIKNFDAGSAEMIANFEISGSGSFWGIDSYTVGSELYGSYLLVNKEWIQITNFGSKVPATKVDFGVSGKFKTTVPFNINFGVSAIGTLTATLLHKPHLHDYCNIYFLLEYLFPYQYHFYF